MNQDRCALRERLEHWRGLIEPEIARDGLTPVSWDELLRMPGVMLYEADRSVVLAVDSAAGRQHGADLDLCRGHRGRAGPGRACEWGACESPDAQRADRSGDNGGGCTGLVMA